jgi:hypothetical protein
MMEAVQVKATCRGLIQIYGDPHGMCNEMHISNEAALDGPTLYPWLLHRGGTSTT